MTACVPVSMPPAGLAIHPNASLKIHANPPLPSRCFSFQGPVNPTGTVPPTPVDSAGIQKQKKPTNYSPLAYAPMHPCSPPLVAFARTSRHLGRAPPPLPLPVPFTRTPPSRRRLWRHECFSWLWRVLRVCHIIGEDASSDMPWCLTDGSPDICLPRVVLDARPQHGK